jgi:hypothetical protein
LTIKWVRSSRNYFCCTSLFLKGSFEAKKLDMELEKTYDLFLEGCRSSSFKRQFISLFGVWYKGGLFSLILCKRLVHTYDVELGSIWI